MALSLQLVTLWAVLATLGCGGAVSAPVSQSSPPAGPITLAALSNNPLPANSPGFMAIADGSGFTSTTAVFWNGSELSTSFQTSQILYANVPATLLVQPGTASVYVKDTSAGTVSNTVTFGILSSAAANATVVQLVSSALDGSPANGETAIQPSISATGRFVVFQSAGTNLVPQQVITPWANIYMADTCIGATGTCTPSVQLISVSADGTTGGNGHSYDSTLSQDGRYVAFDSGASNLLANSPSYCISTVDCVYVRDTCMGASSGCTPQTILGSILPGEVGSGGGLPVITASGRYLTFDSNGGGNLVQVYLRDWCVGAPSGCVPNTIPISVNSIGAFGNEENDPQSLSADGQSVGFVSYSTNLIDPSQPAVQSTAMMFVQNTCTDSTVTPCTPGISQVDVPNGGGVANNQLDYEAISSLSSDGRYISYSSQATNLVSQNVDFTNVYLRDTCMGATGCTVQNTLVSLGNDGSRGNAGSHQQSMSANGRYIAFTSIATNLVFGLPFPAGTWQDVYVRDTCTGAPTGCYPSTVRVAVTDFPYYQTSSNSGASFPAISADGHYVAFLSSSTNLTSAGGNGNTQVFLSKTGF
jgi:hypothetical protein